ncbi:MAG: Gmad2 immunoglobulin-like domain-containing protein [Alphaproteobacteria bacterium]
MPIHRTLALTTAILAGGCVSGVAQQPDACSTADGALNEAAFVIATTPTAGSRVSSGFAVAGCSRTFEGTVVWRLLARDGSVLADGFTMGGAVDGSAPFGFNVDYAVDERQLGHLEVYEEDVSDGEGFPPGRTVLPLVLQP